MVERLMPYNIDVRYVPGKQRETPDFSSRNPISEENHELFKIEVGRLGICVSSRRVIDVKDPRLGQRMRLI